MARNKILQLRVNQQELEALDRLAKKEARGRSEAMRELIRKSLIERNLFYDRKENAK